MKIKVKKGISLSLKGKVRDEVIIAKTKSVGIIGTDYPNMMPKILVNVGDFIKKGQPLFVDKTDENIKFTSPASGQIKAINRGDKRVFQSIEIETSNDEQSLSFSPIAPSPINKEDILKNLLDSGLWTSIRSRPYGQVANYKVKPSSIFVNMMDNDPYALKMNRVLSGKSKELETGIKALELFTDRVFVCKAPETDILLQDSDKTKIVNFEGKYPAGLVGTHIHNLDPIYGEKIVWYIDIQDVLAIGVLLLEGQLDFSRFVAMGGEGLKHTGMVCLNVGANIEEIVEHYLDKSIQSRVISGSVFSGRKATGAYKFLGRFHKHISVVKETDERSFMPWAAPGFKKYSFLNIFASKLFCDKLIDFDTNINGSRRAMIPLGTYEEVFAMDLMITQLLRAVMTGDMDEAEKLGVLELEEEDLGLVSFICHSKHDFGVLLRKMLNEMSAQ